MPSWQCFWKIWVALSSCKWISDSQLCGCMCAHLCTYTRSQNSAEHTLFCTARCWFWQLIPAQVHFFFICYTISPTVRHRSCRFFFFFPHRKDHNNSKQHEKITHHRISNHQKSITCSMETKTTISLSPTIWYQYKLLRYTAFEETNFLHRKEIHKCNFHMTGFSGLLIL